MSRQNEIQTKFAKICPDKNLKIQHFWEPSLQEHYLGSCQTQMFTFFFVSYMEWVLGLPEPFSKHIDIIKLLLKLR